jgi:amidophosphoribosyltransferase
MVGELHHECGLAAIYHLPGSAVSPLCPVQGPNDVARLVPRMLLDIQNRGQLSAGMTAWNPDRNQLLATHKDVGSVSEVFGMSHRSVYERLMDQHTGPAAIGHVRYATCGAEDRGYAQPLERPHIQKRKWFSFGFNGQLANYPELRAEILADGDNHLARDNDTEVILHAIGRELSGDAVPSPTELLAAISRRFDGAWNIAVIDACGRMIVARDPLGIRPMEYAIEGPLVAAASESVALLNLGFAAESIRSLEPGTALIVDASGPRIERFAESPRRAHCFFEWVYFANVASTMDERSVYLVRKRLGEELARLETVPIDADTVVVPVPDTSKAAADAMAYRLSIPSVEGLIRNRYTGRTFIDGAASRRQKAESKYTPLREVLEGKRVILVEDSIVRSTTMKVLLGRMRSLGLAREIHALRSSRRASTGSTCRRSANFSPRRSSATGCSPTKPRMRWPIVSGPIRSAISRSTRWPAPLTCPASRSAKPVSRAATRRRRGRSSTRSPSGTTLAVVRGPTRRPADSGQRAAAAPRGKASA